MLEGRVLGAEKTNGGGGVGPLRAPPRSQRDVWGLDSPRTAGGARRPQLASPGGKRAQVLWGAPSEHGLTSHVDFSRSSDLRLPCQALSMVPILGVSKREGRDLGVKLRASASPSVKWGYEDDVPCGIIRGTEKMAWQQNRKALPQGALRSPLPRLPGSRGCFFANIGSFA